MAAFFEQLLDVGREKHGEFLRQMSSQCACARGGFGNRIGCRIRIGRRNGGLRAGWGFNVFRIRRRAGAVAVIFRGFCGFFAAPDPQAGHHQ